MSALEAARERERRARENWQAARREKRARPLNAKADAEEKRTWAALTSARTSLWHLERKKRPGA